MNIALQTIFSNIHFTLSGVGGRGGDWLDYVAGVWAARFERVVDASQCASGS